MTSAELYATLTSTFTEAERMIQAETSSTKGVIFSTYYDGMYGKGGNELSFHIRNGFGNDAIEVCGRDFWDCVAEFIRRVNFASRQANLQLGPPIIEV